MARPATPAPVSGASKCTSFYFTTLDITILNDWNIGMGFWSPTAAAFSAQALAEFAGFAATNQYLSIWNAVGGTLAGLEAQFDGVQAGFYWSDSALAGGGFRVDLRHQIRQPGLRRPGVPGVGRGCAPRRCGRFCAGATDAGTGTAGIGRHGGGAEKAASLRLRRFGHLGGCPDRSTLA